MLKSLWNHLSKRRHKQFGLLMALVLLASIAEIISIGAVLPFLGVLTAPESVYQHQLMQPVNNILNITSSDQLLIPLTVAFIVAALLAGAIRLTMLYVSTRLSFAVGADLSINIYRRTLYQEYAVHISRNSSSVINGITSKTGSVINGVISPTINLISSTIIITVILTTLFVIDVAVALTATLSFGTLYLCVIFYTKKQLRKNSQIIAEKSTQKIKSLQEGLGGIRDVLIDNSQQFYCNLYYEADNPLRRASGDNIFIRQSPRFVMEAVGMTVIAVIAYAMSFREDGLTTAVPTLGALALGAQRLLPSLQQAYNAYSTIKGSHSSFQDVLDLLDQPLPAYTDYLLQQQIQFEQKIHLNNLSFRYDEDAHWILKNINLTLIKGERIGFIGATGSGKSTLLDIIMGLLSPTYGSLLIDEHPITKENMVAWRAHIAHVPQNIFLSDSSIEENIAFGVPREKIDHQKVEEAAKKAQLAELIGKWKDGYKTFVGERGVRLSGGQRQRIGIARALYKQANVLVFDEATSALDNKTEYAVMEAIAGLDKELTILIIAHRLTTLKGCDQIVKLDNNVIQTGSYHDMMGVLDDRF